MVHYKRSSNWADPINSPWSDHHSKRPVLSVQLLLAYLRRKDIKQLWRRRLANVSLWYNSSVIYSSLFTLSPSKVHSS